MDTVHDNKIEEDFDNLTWNSPVVFEVNKQIMSNCLLEYIKAYIQRVSRKCKRKVAIIRPKMY